MLNLIRNFEPVLPKHHVLSILPYKAHVGKQGANRLLDCAIGRVNGCAHGLHTTWTLPYPDECLLQWCAQMISWSWIFRFFLNVVIIIKIRHWISLYFKLCVHVGHFLGKSPTQLERALPSWAPTSETGDYSGSFVRLQMKVEVSSQLLGLPLVLQLREGAFSFRPGLLNFLGRSHTVDSRCLHHLLSAVQACASQAMENFEVL